MNPYAFLIVAIVMLSPIFYVIGEIKGMRSLRIASIVILFPACFFTSWGAGSLSRFNYNAWYGASSKNLIDEVAIQIEAGRTRHVLSTLRGLSTRYSPTYENKANYDVLTDEAVKKMKEPTDAVHPGGQLEAVPRHQTP